MIKVLFIFFLFCSSLNAEDVVISLTGGTNGDVPVRNTSSATGVSWSTIPFGSGVITVPGIIITGGTVTASTPLITATQTWNNPAVAFVGADYNFTVTAASESAINNIYTGSKFANWRRNGIDKAAIMSNGKIVMTPVGGLGGAVGPSYGWIGAFNAGFDFDTLRNAGYYVTAGILSVGFGPGGVSVAPGGKLSWGASINDALSSADTGVCRNSAGVVEFNNGTCGALRDYKYRHSVGGGIAPTVGDTSADSCGSGAQIIAGSDERGRVTVIGSGGSSCTVTFGSAYGTAPVCMAVNQTTGVPVSCFPTATSFALSGTFAQNDVIAYMVGGY